MNNRNRPGRFVRAVKKLLLSAFLILTFGAYAVEHSGRTGNAAPAPTPAAVAAARTPGGEATAGPTAPPPATAPPSAQPPTDTPAPVQAPGSLYKDGTYRGPAVDVQWGLVQVQATIREGKISDVQFLQFPSDRRTSQRINSQADPWLQQEAIQAQSANVDIIGGATLTSEGFAESLQGALDAARS